MVGRVMAACNSSNSIGMFLIRHMIMVLLSNLTDSAQNWKLSAFEYLHLRPHWACHRSLHY